MPVVVMLCIGPVPAGREAKGQGITNSGPGWWSVGGVCSHPDATLVAAELGGGSGGLPSSSHVICAKFGGTWRASVLRRCALAFALAFTLIVPVACWWGGTLLARLCWGPVLVLLLAPAGLAAADAVPRGAGLAAAAVCCPPAVCCRCSACCLAMVPSLEVGSSLGGSRTRIELLSSMAGCCCDVAAIEGVAGGCH